MPQAIRIKLISKESLLNGNSNELRLLGIVERDANDGRLGTELIERRESNIDKKKSILERNGRSNDALDIKQQINGNDSLPTSVNRQQEPGIIRYVSDGIESTIQYLSNNLSNTSTLYCGDKVRHVFFYLSCSCYLIMNDTSHAFSEEIL